MGNREFFEECIRPLEGSRVEITLLDDNKKVTGICKGAFLDIGNAFYVFVDTDEGKREFLRDRQWKRFITTSPLSQKANKFLESLR